MPGKLRSVFVRLVSIFVSLGFILGILEVVVRVLGVSGPLLFVRDPEVGNRYVRGYRGVAYEPEAARRVHLRFNNEGFRGADLPRDKPAGTRRVAVVGDSMVIAIGAEEEETFVRLLQDKLEDGVGGSWEVANFGVASSSTAQQLKLYRHVISDYSPDLVLLAYFVGNDFADNCHWLTRGRRIYFDVTPKGELVQLPYRVPANASTSAWLNTNSQLYTWLKLSESRIRHRMRKQAGLVNWSWRIFDAEPSAELERCWQLNERLIARFAEDVTVGGTHLVLVVVPSGEQVYDDGWDGLRESAGEGNERFDRDYPDRRLRAIAEWHGIGIHFLRDDLLVQARKDGEVELQDRLYLSDGRGHFSTGGHQAVAASLYDYFSRVLRPQR